MTACRAATISIVNSAFLCLTLNSHGSYSIVCVVHRYNIRIVQVTEALRLIMIILSAKRDWEIRFFQRSFVIARLKTLVRLLAATIPEISCLAAIAPPRRPISNQSKVWLKVICSRLQQVNERHHCGCAPSASCILYLPSTIFFFLIFTTILSFDRLMSREIISLLSNCIDCDSVSISPLR